MTGRARGRARGRGRGGDDDTRPEPRPGVISADGGQVGRGRSRGAVPGQDLTPGSVVPEATSPPPQDRREADSNKAEDADLNEGISRMRVLVRPEGTEGGAGQQVNLLANFFKLSGSSSNNLTFYQYNVTFSPEVNSKKLKCGLLHETFPDITRPMLFDGFTLFHPRKLPDPVTKATCQSRRSGEAFEVTVTLTLELTPGPAHIFIIKNMLKRTFKILGMNLVGRDHFFISTPIELPQHKLEVWPGHSTNVVQQKGNDSFLLNVGISHKVVSQPSVLEYMYALYNKDQRDFYDIARTKLVGQIVVTRYNNRTYRIDDIDFDKRPTHTFKMVNGQELSYVDYYQKVYEKEVTDMQQPMLISKIKNSDSNRGMTGDLCLLPEFCYVIGLSDEVRENFQIMKDLARHTRTGPDEHLNTIQKFVASINGNEEARNQWSAWGLELKKDVVKFDGRVLPPETIYQKGKKCSYDPKSADWSRETRGNELHSTINLDNWLVIFTERDTGIAQDFIQTLQRVSGPLGMEFKKPEQIKLTDDSARTYVQAIKDNVKDDVQLVVAIVPNNRKDRYDAIKKLCFVERPVPSQCIVSRTLSKKQMLMSVCTKIAIQISAKLGGEAWAVEIPVKELMVVGICVQQDKLSKGKYIVCLTASTNQTLTKYHSRVAFINSTKEVADQLTVMMTCALRKYNEINGSLPDRVIVYRDGEEGGLDHVYDHEVPAIQKAATDVQDGYKPKLGVIVLKRKTTERIYAYERGQASNPPPGTVVDTTITRPEWYDFFLVSHSVRQGMPIPVHYNVICDTTGLKPDHIQRLTYKLTHLYVNWPGTILVPAPCQYAKKLATLVGDNIHSDIAGNLHDRLVYL